MAIEEVKWNRYLIPQYFVVYEFLDITENGHNCRALPSCLGKSRDETLASRSAEQVNEENPPEDL